MTQQQIDERGNHALVFFSLILALSITNLVEAWTKSFSFGLKPKNLIQPEGFFLIGVSVLSFQYWWVIYQSRSFYGKDLWRFALGVGESVTLYALTVILRDTYSKGVSATTDQRSSCFLFSIILIALYLLFDFFRPTDKWKSRRQGFRIVGICFAIIGWIAVDESIRTIMAGFIAVMTIAYTIDKTLTI